MEIQTKELSEIKIQVSTVQDAANALVVNSSESMAKATDALYNVTQAEKFIVSKKEEITRPLMSSLAKVRDLFKPLEGSLSEAKKVIKSKMLAYQIEEDDRINKEKERIAKRVEKGTMRADTAASKLETVGNAPTSTKGEVGKASIREVKKVRIVDEFLVPREYLIVNLVAVTEAIIRKGLTVPGAEMYLDKIIASR